MAVKKQRAFLEGTFNVVGAATYILSCGFLVLDFLTTHRISDILMLGRRFLFALFFIVRKTPPKQTNTSPRDWLVAFCGTYMQNFLRPTPQGHDSIIIGIIQALGFIVCIGGALSLNESFGVVAANRGVKSKGMYRFMRHPIYAGYFLEAGAFLAQNLSIDNIIIMLIWAAFQFRRIFVEEQFLSADPAYVAYQKKVPWRLIPFVW